MSSDGRTPGPGRADHRWRAASLVTAILCLFGGLVIALWQVEVGAGTVHRACGSPFDAAVDRTGWESWWAADVDDPNATAREELLRTVDCPDALNRAIAVAGTLCAVGLCLIIGPAALSRERTGRVEIYRADLHRRLHRIGVATATVGSALTVGGAAALVVLLADSESTLFLYTDRLVVAVGGLIVLVPAVALAIGGWTLQTAAHALGSHDEM